MSSFEKPQTVSVSDLTFGGDMKILLPPLDLIPKEFQESRTDWNKLITTWFFQGLSSFDCKPKPGIDRKQAMGHVKAILGSWEPRHEHKEAACAWLLSKWFEEPIYTAKG
ncbi:hypothetical protein [Paenibacillus polymyxa]|uniref:hypothetical protein n=1 Tax=Paenibacillus polymyxa TaxID=1406 RepID=UPI000737C6D5|nr:hypothetical protein [Paenibacillus polymyxa]